MDGKHQSPQDEAEAEKNLTRIIAHYKLEPYISVKEIKDFILRKTAGDVLAANRRFQDLILPLLSYIPDRAQNHVLQVFMDAWNYFPHHTLGGKSPHELLTKQQKKSKHAALTKKEHNEILADIILTDLQEMARKRAFLEHTKLGGARAEFKEITQLLAKIVTVDDQKVAEEAISKNGLRLLTSNPARIPETVESYFRACQALVNHTYIYTEDRIGSPLLWCAMDTLVDHGEHPESLNVLIYLETLLSTHKLIMSYHKKVGFDYRARDIAHHVLDWLAIEAPKRFVRQTPNELASLAYGIVGKVHTAITGYQSPVGTTDSLVVLGGWRSTEVYTAEIEKAFVDIVYALQDPHILIIDAEKAPEDWYLRIKSIAPALSDTHNDAKPPEGTPSPWVY